MISIVRNFLYAWQSIYYEIKNWIFVISVIRKHSKTADWNKFNLLYDWVGRIGLVLNPQSPGDDGDTEEVLKIKYTERLKPVNMYLDKIGLSESVTVSYKKIPDSQSYLFLYTPIFQVLTFGKVFFWGIIICIFFFSKLDTYTWNSILWIWEHASNIVSHIF
jgi:hypothetical protein